MKGRALARREAAAALFDALSPEQRAQLQALLVNDPSVGQTRLTWLRGFWNTIYMDKAASHLEQASPLYDAKLLPHTSPLGWEHVILSGDFDWHSGAADRKIARPLNIRPARDWGT